MAMIKKKQLRDTLSGYAFIGPLVVVMVVFLAYPIIKAAIMSVQYWYMPRPHPDGHYFVGLDNYKAVLQDDAFLNSLTVTAIYIVVTVVARFAIGLIAAVLLNYKFKGRAIARALIIIPWAVPEVVTCLVWILMYDKDFGIINFLATNFHLIQSPVNYLNDPTTALDVYKRQSPSLATVRGTSPSSRAALI